MLANSVDEPMAETDVLSISALQFVLEKTCVAISSEMQAMGGNGCTP